MIQKITPAGSGFRGVLNYALAKGKEPELVAGNMAGETARELSREFADARAGNEAIGKPVFHASLAVDPGDQVSPEKWRAIAEAYVERMGYGDSLWVAVRHHDTGHDHIHIIASRVAHDGSRVKDHQDKKRGESIVRDLEKQHGLAQVAPSREAPRRAITRGELAAFERTGEVSVKGRLQEHLDIAARGRPTMQEFGDRLLAQGVGLRVHVASTGRVSGISFELDGVTLKGSDVGRAYSWRGLQERLGVSYEPARDLPRLQALSSFAFSREEPEAKVSPRLDPMPQLERPVEAYRQVAILVSRTELEDRRDAFLDGIRTWGGALVQADAAVREKGRSDSTRASCEAEAFRQLSGVYRDPEAAARQLRELIDRSGYEGAARTLREAPEQLGRLQGAAVGPLQTEARQQALRSASTIEWRLQEAGQWAAHAARDGKRAEELLVQVPKARERRDGFERLKSLLPDVREVQKELVRAAERLGLGVVEAISVRIAREVTRLAMRMGRELLLGRDDGLGR